MNIEVDLHDFSDEEIEEYARSYLDMVKDNEVNIEAISIEKLTEEIEKRGSVVLDFDASISIIQKSLLDRLIGGFENINLQKLEEFLNQNNL